LKERRIDPSKLHAAFSSALPATAAIEKLDALDPLPDRFTVKAQEVYLTCPNGYGRTKLSNNALEKLLSVEATTRNWRTVNTLSEM
jgi:uncharacterized protein (DUF1697 family)